MKTKPKINLKTKQQLLLEMEKLRTRLDATERRLQEANEILQAQIAERKRVEQTFEKAQEYAESIINTVREPLIALDQDLRVVSVSRSFYEVFKVNPKETVGQLIYDLGNKQWDIPKLRELLETVLPEKATFDNYEVEHDFASIGRRIMLLNARQIKRAFGKERIILLAIEDITERKRLEILLSESEERYRRLFETANDGILLLEKSEGNITHANPAVTAMLGYSKEECIGNKLQDIGFSHDMGDFREIMHTLDRSGIIYYDDVPIKTKAGQTFYVDIYLVDRARLVQCNIRDITERKRAEEALYRRDLELRTALSEIKTLKDQLEAENIIFRQEIKMRHQFDHILGQSDGLKYVLYRAEQVAPMNTTVLILGETGTGKDLIAAAIHDMSPRKERPLITVNCAALPGNLIESELFGREKGAFTGADTRQVGRFEIANGSSLCLDEIGELPLEVQAKLLRVIQHNEFERLGSSQTIKVDVRIVATTNRNLEEEVRKGRFRQDLYYRLNVFPITVPPLRQRKEDIPLLVQAFIERYSRKLGKQITSIQKETLKALQDYPWPGNIRELESIIERAVILCPGPVLELADKLEISSLSLSSTLRTLEETERNQILKTLSETRWRIEGKDGAAAILGLNPSTLRARMHKLGIVRPETKESD